MSTEHTHEVGHGHDGDAMVKLIWRVFWIMLGITIVEIVVAVALGHILPRWSLNAFFIIMSLWKAILIVGTFMHLKFEIKHLIITVLIPVVFLLYALAILLTEGSSWLHMQTNP